MSEQKTTKGPSWDKAFYEGALDGFSKDLAKVREKIRELESLEESLGARLEQCRMLLKDAVRCGVWR